MSDKLKSKMKPEVAARLVRLVRRKVGLESKLEVRMRSFANIIQSFDCSKCKSLSTRIQHLDVEIFGHAPCVRKE